MAKPYPTQARLKELFDYNPDTGEFTRLVSIGRGAKSNKGHTTIGSVSTTSGYARLNVDGVLYLSHRLAWVHFYGCISEALVIDHINRVRTDNRICNLRLATNTQNRYNTKTQSNNTSGTQGVTYHKGTDKWSVRIVINKERKWLGTFGDLNQAIKVREMAEKKHYIHAPVTPELIE